MYDLNFRKYIFERIKPRTITNPELLNKWAGRLNKPHWNRLTMGAGALALQPLIDYFNPLVDDDTASTSAIRTASKIIAGTAVGVIVRTLAYKYTSKNPYRSKFMTKAIFEFIKRNPEAKKNYFNAISTLIGLGAMVFTNFLLDAPLTNVLTKFGLKQRNTIKAKKQETANPQNNVSPNNPAKTSELNFEDTFNKFRNLGRRENNV